MSLKSLPTRPHYDVIVVGARAAGASTALLLARAGLSVLVVERGRYGADTLSTHALMRGGVLQLARWGLLDRIIDLGTPAVREVRFHYAHDVVTVPIARAGGVDALYAPRRTILDQVLVDAAAAAGADVRFGLAMTGLRRDHRGRVCGVEAMTRGRRTVTVGARLVVGADGTRSAVAAAAGAEVQHRGRTPASCVYGYWSGVPAAGYEWAYRRGVTAGFIPTNWGELCVFAGGPPTRIGRGGRRVFDEVLLEAAPELAMRLTAGTPRRMLRTHPGRPGHLRRAWGPGWALVGDAGSWKDPVTAHGLTDALRDAELLARATVAVLSGEAAEHDAFGAYQSIRDRLTLPLLTLSDEVAGCRWSDTAVVALLRGLSEVTAAEIEVIVGMDATPLASTA
jgi:2-polyprenyl-6-methoxyphenol hydroxylase-like FAD-dependent oxidoreductase